MISMKMKKTFFTPILVLVTLISFGQSGFEGEIVMETKTAKTNETATVVLKIKGANTRMDVSSSTPDYSSEYAIIVDGSGAAMVSKGVVTELDAAKFNQPANSNMKLVSTTEGVSKNGYSTTYYVFSDEKSEARYWIADEFGVNYSELPAMFKKGVPMPAGGFAGIPIAVEMVDENGEVRSSQKLISVTVMEVPTSVFNRK